MGIEKQFLVFFLSGRLRQVLLYKKLFVKWLQCLKVVNIFNGILSYKTAAIACSS